MDTLSTDLRYALRQLVRAPGFTLVALLTLGLGIGVNTAMFSVVNAVLFRPVPVAEPERLVRIFTSQWEQSGIPSRFYGASSYPDLADFRRSLGDVLEGIAGYELAQLALDVQGTTARLPAAFVTEDFFEVYRVRPSEGRGILPSEIAGAGASDVVVITERVWRARFGADRAIIGRPTTIGGDPFTIVGVVSERSLGPLHDRGADLILPMHAYPRLTASQGMLEGRSNRSLDLIGRLRPGVSVERAQAALTAVGERLGQEYPEESGNRRYTLRSASTMAGFFSGDETQLHAASAVVMGVVGLVLLIAGANVANLLLARATRRGREIVIRLSLGAARGRVVRQLLTESVVLAFLGGAVAVVLAAWAVDAVRVLPLPDGIVPAIDARVLAFNFVVALGTGILFGLAPALHGTRHALASANRAGTHVAGSRSRLRTGLIVAQIALSFLLLVPAGLLARTLYNMRDGDPGFDAERMVVASIEVDRRRFEERAARALQDRVLERVSALPGVEAASLSSLIPFGGGRSRTAVTVAGYEPRPDESMEIHTVTVSRDFFRTLGVAIVGGASFDDIAAGAPVIVVNEAMARRFWSGRDAVGRTLRFGSSAAAPVQTVIGVVRDAQLEELTRPAVPMIFRPLPREGSPGVNLLVRAPGAPEHLIGAVRAELAAIEPSLAEGSVRPLTDPMAERVLPSRIAASAMGMFGTMALLLAAVGLYGVMAFIVSLRTREIGIRMALGAERRVVLGLVLGDGLRVAVIGIVLGTLLALAVTRVLAAALYGVAPWDPLTFVGIATLMCLVAAAASWVPARRAAAIDPTVALQAE